MGIMNSSDKMFRIILLYGLLSFTAYPLEAGIYPSALEISFTHSFSPETMEISPGTPFTITLTVTNQETSAIRGLYVSEQIHKNFTMETESVSINGRAIADYTVEEGEESAVYEEHVPYYWIIESGPEFEENTALQTGDVLEIIYTLISGEEGVYPLDKEGVFGLLGADGPAFFLFDDTYRSLEVTEVPGRNDPPVARNDAVTTFEQIPILINVLSNDSDPDGIIQPSTLTIKNEPSHGLITEINLETGTMRYTPEIDFNGIDIFTYTVEDDSSVVSNEATVTVTVNPINDAPEITSFPLWSFNEDDSVVVSLISLYEYVYDPDHPDSLLTFSFKGGKHMIIRSERERVTIRAVRDWHGIDTIQVNVSDGQLADSVNIELQVYAINDPPYFVNLPDSVHFLNTSDTVLIMNEFVSDIDSPRESLRWEFLSSNDSMIMDFDSQTSALTFRAPGFSGIVDLQCIVTDDSSAQTEATIIVKVDQATAVENDFRNIIPAEYQLIQNNPNPFNPITHIRFGMKKAGDVNIYVYNTLGQKIAAIWGGFRPAGYHTVTFDAGDLAGGLYFYRMQTSDFSGIKKMILVR